MEIKVYSRKAIEKLLQEDFPDNVAVISFCDPESSKSLAPKIPVDYSQKCNRVFQIAVHDIDLGTLADFNLTYDTYLPEAEDLAKFIYSAKDDGLDIICQCEYGQSRSAACAAAIQEHFYKTGIWIFADYKYYPNQLIFNKVYNALEILMNIREELLATEK